MNKCTKVISLTFLLGTFLGITTTEAPVLVLDSNGYEKNNQTELLSTGNTSSQISYIPVASMRGIITPVNDRRTRVEDFNKYPFVGRIKGIGSGTGFVVGEDYIVTNRHVAKKAIKTDTGYTGEFRPSQIGDIDNQLPFGTFYFKDLVLSEGSLDLAVIKVSKQNNNPNGLSLGSVVTPVQLKQFDSSDKVLTLVGYPGPRPGYYQWEQTNSLSLAQLNDINNPVIKYDIDTEAGQSGSPLLNDSGQVVAVHSTAYTSINGGERLTSDNLKFITDAVKQLENRSHT